MYAAISSNQSLTSNKALSEENTTALQMENVVSNMLREKHELAINSMSDKIAGILISTIVHVAYTKCLGSV